MRIYFHVRSLFVVTVLIMTAGNLPAATIEVPGGQPTIQGAIDAAAPGDTILITDSGTYASESISLDKQIRLEAAPGENPTITNSGDLNLSSALFFVADDAAFNGSKIGSIDGGRINLIINPTAPGFGEPARAYVFNQLGGGADDLTSLTLENLFISQETGGNIDNSYNVTVLRDDGGSTRTFTYSHVEIDDNGNKNSESLRQNNEFGYHALDNCYFHGYSGAGYPLYAREGTQFDITNSAFDNSESTAQTLVIFTPAGDRHPVINIDGSILIGGTGGVFFRRTATGFLTLTNSVFIAHDSEIYYPFNANDQPDYIDADHCDFIVFNDETEDIAIISPEDDTENNISITNSNIIGIGSTPGGSTIPAVEIDATLDGTVVLDHNNVHAPGWAGGLYHASLTPTNSVSLDPEYSGDLLIGDARYDNATLKTADSTGGAIGTDQSFEELMPQPPPPPNAARHWTLF